MYLTKMILNPLNKDARRDAAYPYELHRTLARAHGWNDDSRPAFLFRLEQPDYKHGSITVISQASLAAPRIDPMLESGYLLAGETKFIEDDFLRSSLKQGAGFFFRLKANTSVKREGHKYAIDTEEGRFAWLMKKAAANGFRVLNANAAKVTIGSLNMTRSFKGKSMDEIEKHSLFHVGCIFDGILSVEDSGLFAKAVTNGIGQGKAFGFGLLSIKPMNGA